MTDESTSRKPRRKATTEVGRAIMQRERQRMAREQAQLGEALMRESKVIHPDDRTAPAPVDVEHNAIARGIVRRITAVLASEEVNVPIFVQKGQEGRRPKAWTDFDRISVTYEPHEDKRVLAATLRGLFYHEGGHCRWTLPPRQLWAEVVVQSGGDENTAPWATRNAPRASNGTRNTDVLHTAWNMLEDQRMETAVVSDSPRKAAYLTPLIMSIHTPTPTAMASNYPLLIWRKYLPRHLRQAARKMFVANHNIVGKDGEFLATAAEAIVERYVLAIDVLTMWQAVCDFHDLLQDINPVAAKDFGHNQQQSRRASKQSRDLDDFLIIPIDSEMLDEEMSGDEPQDEAEPTEPEYDLTDPEVAAQLTMVLIAAWNYPETLVPVIRAATGAPGEPEENDDAAPAPSAPRDEQDEQDEQDDSGKQAGDGTHANEDDAHANEDFTQDDLDELLQEAEDERNEMRELDGDMRAFDEARDQTSSLGVYTAGLSGDIPAINKAVALADEIERSFNMSTMDRQPAWVEGQKRGMLNVLRYETRRPGETEVFRQWTDDEQPGFDMAVSLLLDYSGSMDEYTMQLAQAAFATKLACQRLGIPCTVTLWDEDAMVLWDATEVAEGMPIIRQNGGTDPTRALQDLDNQRFDRSKHIVMIMTDGEWNSEWSKRTLAAYKDAGRQIYGFGLGGNHLRKGLIAKGCDNAWGIDDLMEIPHRLEQFLIEAA